MSVIWENYLNIAKELHSKIDLTRPTSIDDAYGRSAISRAYYAVYNIALENAVLSGYLKAVGNEAGKNHGGVKDFYVRGSTNDLKKIGNALSRLHKNRISADYNDPVLNNTNGTLASAIADADLIVSLIP